MTGAENARSQLTGIGAPVRRKEDMRLITGAGCFADDLPAARAAHAVFVRSPHAHARIRKIDFAAARAMPGVLDILTASQANADGVKSIPHATGSSFTGTDVPLKNIDGTERRVSGHLPLADGIARFCGEAVAVVIAETADAARDAAEKVIVDWEALPAVTRSFEAVKESAPQVWPDIPGNIALDAIIGDVDGTQAAFEKAVHHVKLQTWVNRVTGVHMEPRTALAEFDVKSGVLTLHASLGIGVVVFRNEIAGALGIPLEQVRIIAPPDVGGNFGTRNATYPEFVVIAWAARRLKRAVKHVPDRSEAFLTDYQARDLHVEAELALDEKGRFLAVRTTNLSNIGGHTTSFVALNKGVQLMTSVYNVPVAQVRGRAVVTHTPPTIPYRSAGRPEAMFVVERLIDVAAHQCGFDRVALRRKNLIKPGNFPWRNPFGVTYDNGTYEAVMQTAMDMADWKGFAKRRREAAKAGVLRGIGVANYVETTSGFPRERADITITPDGIVDCIVGTQATGQGHETSFSQLLCEWLGVPFDKIDIRYGDTNFVQAGGGSHSGRSMRFASVVINEAALEIIEKGRKMASALLEADALDIEFSAGRYAIKGTDRSISLFEVAAAATTQAVPKELRGELKAFCDKTTIGLAFPFGAHVCEVEIDPQTGVVRIVNYIAVDDVGKAVNPMILDGQTHGGIAQGAGQALWEQCFYDPADGQLLSASFMDYAMPRADHFPFFNTHLSEVPATSHPLGFRPGGEGGTTPALGVIVNAAVDALKDYDITHLDMPLTPQRVWRAMQEARRTR